GRGLHLLPDPLPAQAEPGRHRGLPGRAGRAAPRVPPVPRGGRHPGARPDAALADPGRRGLSRAAGRRLVLRSQRRAGGAGLRGPRRPTRSPTLGMAAIAVTAIVTVLVGVMGVRAARTTSDFYVASRSVTPWWNASAIGGEYLSAASFLGVAGLV